MLPKSHYTTSYWCIRWLKQGTWTGEIVQSRNEWMRCALKAFTEITEADFCLFVCMTDLSHYHQKVPIKEVNCYAYLYKGLTAGRASSGPFCLFLLPRNKIFQHYSITFYYSITLTIKVECSRIEKFSCLFILMASSCVFDWGCLVD